MPVFLRGRKPSPSPNIPPAPLNMPTVPASHPFIIPLPIDPEMFVQDVVDGKVPRPCNSWILFRREVTRNWPSWMGPLPAQGKVSAITKALWDSLTVENRQLWDDLAEQIKVLHKLRFPDYKFKPMKREEKERLIEAKKLAAAEKKEQARLAKLNKSNATASGSRGPVPVAVSTRPQPYYFPTTHFSQFHPAGASPAMSYASLAEEEEERPAASSSSESPAAESPFPKTPLTQPTSPLPYPFEAFQLPEKAAEPGAPSALEAEAAQPFDTEAAANVYQAWEGVEVPTTTPTEQPAEDYNYNGMTLEELAAQSMLFTVPPPTFNAVDNWLVNDNASTFDNQLDVMNSNVDFQAFELNNFPDPNEPGPLDVYLGPLSPSLDPALLLPTTEVSGNNLGPFYELEQLPMTTNDGDFNNDFLLSLIGNFFDGQQYQAEQTYLAQPSYQAQQPYQTQEQFQPMFTQDFLAADQSMKNMALQPVENTAVDFSSQSYTPAVNFASTGSYIPPTGALNSGLRRAGGSYKKDLRFQSSMSDLEI